MTARSAFAVAVVLVAAAHACTYDFDRFEQKADAGEGEPDATDGADATAEAAGDDDGASQGTPDAEGDADADVVDAGEDAAADADAE